MPPSGGERAPRGACAGGRPGAGAGRSAPAALAVPASAAAASTTEEPGWIVGVGSAGVDYLASVAGYPEPDAKVRTERLEVQGGGNAANALTAAARLGGRTRLLTKIVDDGMGKQILGGLAVEHVDAAHVIIAPAADGSSPFTYIIVDRAGSTRTCIHTPGPALSPAELTRPRVAALLAGAALVYFDGRLTEAALEVARAARALPGVLLLVEAERLRPGLEQLLALADVVVTSTGFPMAWTGEADPAEAMLEVARRLPAARSVITTLGAEGAVQLEMLGRGPGGPGGPSAAGGGPGERHLPRRTLTAAIAGLREQAGSAAAGPAAAAGAGGAAAARVRPRPAVASEELLLVKADSEEIAEAGGAAAARARRAAEAAAVANADSANAAKYAASSEAARPAGGPAAGAGLAARVHFVPAAAIAPGDVIDTTGAGDAFIGAVCYSLVRGLPPATYLPLAAYCAAQKLTALGARPGLPRRGELPASLQLPD